MPTAHLVARFIRFYGAATYRGNWPTRDGVIPWQLFAVLFQAIGAAQVAEQLQDARAVAHGIALSLNGNDPKVKTATDKLIKQAYPED